MLEVGREHTVNHQKHAHMVSTACLATMEEPPLDLLIAITADANVHSDTAVPTVKILSNAHLALKTTHASMAELQLETSSMGVLVHVLLTTMEVFVRAL